MGDLDLENNQTITTCDNYKNLGIRTEKDAPDEKEISERTGEVQKAIKWVTGIWYIRKYLRK
jgi:hypothetical protein